MWPFKNEIVEDNDAELRQLRSKVDDLTLKLELVLNLKAGDGFDNKYHGMEIKISKVSRKNVTFDKSYVCYCSGQTFTIFDSKLTIVNFVNMISNDKNWKRR